MIDRTTLLCIFCSRVRYSLLSLLWLDFLLRLAVVAVSSWSVSAPPRCIAETTVVVVQLVVVDGRTIPNNRDCDNLAGLVVIDVVVVAAAWTHTEDVNSAS